MSLQWRIPGICEMTRIKYKEAAGLEIKSGRTPKGKKPGKSDLERLYVRELRSIREIAEILGCSKDMVYRVLQGHGIKRRDKIRRSQLRVYKLDFLRNQIKNKGYKQVAAELGVGVTTLREYINANR